MTLRPSTAPLVGALLLTASACVPLPTGEKMLRDIEGLQRTTFQSRKTLEQQGAQLAEQRQKLTEQMERGQAKIEEVAVILQTLNRATRMTDADFGVQIERLIKEVQELRGAVELTEFRLSQLEQHFKEDTSIIDRITALEDRLETLSVPSRKASSGGSKARIKTKPKSKKSLLSYAQQLVKDGKPAEARGVYREIIRSWPNTTGVTDEAYFRLGELYYKARKYRSALQEYINVAEKFSKGILVDDAYYRIGVCSMQIGKLEDAKIFFNAVIKDHPKSSLVKASKGKIKEIQNRLKREKKKS